jgi:TolB protein
LDETCLFHFSRIKFIFHVIGSCWEVPTWMVFTSPTYLAQPKFNTKNSPTDLLIVHWNRIVSEQNQVQPIGSNHLMSLSSCKRAVCLSLGIALLSLCGCGGNSASPAVLTVAFQSNAALDGSNNTNAAGNIWISKSDGSGLLPLTRLTTAGADSLEPIWSPDGKKIAFVSARALDGSDAAIAANNIWVMNADGSGAAPITRLTTSGITDWQLTWSHDGQKLAFASSAALDGSDALNANSAFNIWVMNADGTGRTPVTGLTVPEPDSSWTSQEPIWSPDSTKMVFLSNGALDGTDALNPNRVFNLWAAKADGSGVVPLTRLSSNGVWQSYPAWSPDGARIAFMAQRALDGSDAGSPTNAENLWTINADGSSATPLTRFTASGFMFYPVWSPDGSKIAFGADLALDGSDALNTNGAANVWTINANGTGAFPVTRLTTTGINFVLPLTWSPDGKRIGFTSQRAVDGGDAANPSGQTNVWVLNADGSGAMPLTRLTSGSAGSALPAWHP